MSHEDFNFDYYWERAQIIEESILWLEGWSSSSWLWEMKREEGFGWERQSVVEGLTTQEKDKEGERDRAREN